MEDGERWPHLHELAKAAAWRSEALATVVIWLVKVWRLQVGGRYGRTRVLAYLLPRYLGAYSTRGWLLRVLPVRSEIASYSHVPQTCHFLLKHTHMLHRMLKPRFKLLSSMDRAGFTPLGLHVPVRRLLGTPKKRAVINLLTFRRTLFGPSQRTWSRLAKPVLPKPPAPEPPHFVSAMHGTMVEDSPLVGFRWIPSGAAVVGR